MIPIALVLRRFLSRVRWKVVSALVFLVVGQGFALFVLPLAIDVFINGFSQQMPVDPILNN